MKPNWKAVLAIVIFAIILFLLAVNESNGEEVDVLSIYNLLIKQVDEEFFERDIYSGEIFSYTIYGDSLYAVVVIRDSIQTKICIVKRNERILVDNNMDGLNDEGDYVKYIKNGNLIFYRVGFEYINTFDSEVEDVVEGKVPERVQQLMKETVGIIVKKLKKCY